MTMRQGMTDGQPFPGINMGPTGIGADYQRDWPRYFDAVNGKPPRDTVLFALKQFASEGNIPRRAIDIACGEGRDTRAILASGNWHVTAIDGHEEAVARTRSQLQDPNRCEIVRLKMEEVAGDERLQAPADLINASFALPFCEPSEFPRFWDWLRRTIKPDGRFAGQFFGERDDWHVIRPGSHMTRRQLDELLAGFEIEHLDEVEKDGDDAMGGAKHHHVFHVVARKR